MNDWTTTGILFPGQGAQFVGMGEEIFRDFAAARDVYARASDVLGYDLGEVCFQGPENRLVRTDVCQPAILTTSIAAFVALQETAGRTLTPAVCAGLSLGEYTALVAAGALDFEQAVGLTAARGAFMQQACDRHPGTMCSIIGLSPEAVETVCRQLRDTGASVWPANYNSPQQTVISGTGEAVAAAARACEEQGAQRTVALNVAGPFHTPLMEPAAQQLREKLDDVTFRAACCPVLANVSGRPYGADGDCAHLLAQQVTHPVRWMQSMQWCNEGHITRFLEVGPGRVLGGLLRRIDRRMRCLAVLSSESIQESATWD